MNEGLRRAEDAEIANIRTRLHEVSNELHTATVQLAITSTKLDGGLSQMGALKAQIEAVDVALTAQLDRVEAMVSALKEAKANWDGRFLVLAGGVSLGMSIFVVWVGHLFK